MTDPDSSSRRLPSTPTIALIGAAMVLAASAGVAILRSEGGSDVAAPHGTVTPQRPAAPIEQAIAELEGRLRQDPDNPAGWRMLGWSYFETGALERAAAAYRRAAGIEPDNAENWSSLGEALQVASTAVSPEAARAFDRAIGLDPADPRARYFLAVQKDLAGDHAGAVADWIELLEDTPAGAPWEADLRRTIAQVAEKENIDLAGRLPAPAAGSGATAAIPGPSPEQLAAASSIPPGQQNEMVRGMVDRLDARLRANPRDADGWIRLMRSRMVLGETDRARAALNSGVAVFQGDAATITRLNAAAADLGIPNGS